MTYTNYTTSDGRRVEEVAVFTRRESWGETSKWSLIRNVSRNGNVSSWGVDFFRPGACSPGELPFKTKASALAHLRSISGAVFTPKTEVREVIF